MVLLCSGSPHLATIWARRLCGQLIKPHAVLGNWKQLHATGTRQFVQFDGDIRSRRGIITERADSGEQFIRVRRRAISARNRRREVG